MECEIGSIGVWDLFGSIGMYWDLGFYMALNIHEKLLRDLTQADDGIGTLHA